MTEPEKYQEKPIIVEAMRWFGNNTLDIKEWCVDFHEAIFAGWARIYIAKNNEWLDIKNGDWVVKDEKGFSVFSHETFLATYYKIHPTTIG